jgi:hypothetical protein
MHRSDRADISETPTNVEHAGSHNTHVKRVTARTVWYITRYTAAETPTFSACVMGKISFPSAKRFCRCASLARSFSFVLTTISKYADTLDTVSCDAVKGEITSQRQRGAQHGTYGQ